MKLPVHGIFSSSVLKIWIFWPVPGEKQGSGCPPCQCHQKYNWKEPYRHTFRSLEQFLAAHSPKLFFLLLLSLRPFPDHTSKTQPKKSSIKCCPFLFFSFFWGFFLGEGERGGLIQVILGLSHIHVCSWFVQWACQEMRQHDLCFT